ncbi:MAG: hypothetical protein JNK49_13720 [Planctomycetes bacterium]|nr:hypothetical protein [Planctomycetota bacterium]
MLDPHLPTDQDRAAVRFALAHLSQFAEQHLPLAVLRIARWRRLPAAELTDLRQELHQELVVDCLERAPLLLALPARARVGRWLRRVEHWVYHHRLTWANRRPQAEPEDLAGPPEAPGTSHDPLARLPLVFCGNGRVNLAATRERTGQRERDLRQHLRALAADLGHDAAAAAFWQRRAGEAFAGLGADLLRSSVALPLLGTHWRAPDVARRLTRLHRLLRRVPRGGPMVRVRTLLQRWRRQHRAGQPFDARQALQTAVALLPDAPAGWLWLAEAHLAAGQCRAALQAIRAARSIQRCPRSGQVLARARVLAARGRLPAALALVQRAAVRWHGDPRLRAAQALLGSAHRANERPR